MGEAAREHAAGFTWDRAAEQYDALVGELSRSGAPARPALAAARSGRPDEGATVFAMGPSAGASSFPQEKSEQDYDVTAIILNYGATYETLKKCVASLFAQDYPVEVLMVDNGSPRNLDALDALEKEFPATRILRLDRNYGFAGGMNRGVAAATTEFVLLLNNDVVLEPTAVAEMRRVIDLEEGVIGVAPKTLLESTPNVIDSVGNLIDAQGAAFNMGIGQPDIGQYQRVERTFGACFAATLLRRRAFRPGIVGPLDERYFMYYEDVDWCFRAGVLGFKFLTAPDAVVYHAHSLTTRELHYGFKYRLTMRNLLWTVLRNFDGRRVLRVYARSALGLARGVVRGPYRWANFMALAQAFLWLPVYLRARRQVQGRRRTQDQQLFDYSHGERPYFNPTMYAPERRLEVLEAMYRRLYLLSHEERHRRIAETASALAASRLRFDREFAHGLLMPLVEDEPAFVQEFVASLEV